VADDVKVVGLGSNVRYRGDGVEEEYRIVEHHEADVMGRSISKECPVGKALLGRRVGDLVRVRTPSGSWTATILDVD
jgi:transcription elongation factor GreA